MKQELFPREAIEVLVRNNAESAKAIARDGNTPDHVPALKLFTPMGGATWLLTEYDPEAETFFGLCDLGMGEPELGYVSRGEIEATAFSREPQLIERDEHFRPVHTLSVYVRASIPERRIVEEPSALAEAAKSNNRSMK